MDGESAQNQSKIGLTLLTDGTCRNGGICPLILNVPACAMALVVGRRPPTDDRPVQFQAIRSWIGGKVAPKQGFHREIRLPEVNIVCSILIHSSITDGKQSK